MMEAVFMWLLVAISLLSAGSVTGAEAEEFAKSDGVLKTRSVGTNVLPTTTSPPTDCADHLLLGQTTSGIYEIYPFSCSCRRPVRVWCDMDTDGGGWTVFLTRKNQTTPENFNRSWVEYKEGFGRAEGEFWLGNEMLHRISSSRKYNLRMDLTTTNGVEQFSEWDGFLVEEERNKYRLRLQNYLSFSTTYTNCLSRSNGRYFTTHDRDYDGSSAGNCAVTRGGGWWWYFNNCYNMHLTGVYNQSLNTYCTVQLRVAQVQLKIRPTICEEPFRTISINNLECGGCNTGQTTGRFFT